MVKIVWISYWTRGCHQAVQPIQHITEPFFLNGRKKIIYTLNETHFAVVLSGFVKPFLHIQIGLFYRVPRRHLDLYTETLTSIKSNTSHLPVGKEFSIHKIKHINGPAAHLQFKSEASLGFYRALIAKGGYQVRILKPDCLCWNLCWISSFQEVWKR